MNDPLRKVATLMMALIIVLMLGVTSVQFLQSGTLNADDRNARTLYREIARDRGAILAAGDPIAQSTAVDTSFGFLRQYPEGPLYSAITGHYSPLVGSTGLESTENDLLAGTASVLAVDRLRDLITGAQPRGSTVETTIDPVIQQAAWDALGDVRGAVVVVDPRSGAILAMVSKPAYDPNDLVTHNLTSARESWETLLNDDDDPLINRAIGGDTYAPGSVFKLVTAAAALENGVTTSEQLPSPDVLTLPQTTTTIGNYAGSTCSHSGMMTLTDALRTSCNTTFGQLAMDVGQDAIAAQAEAFGFGQEQSIPLRVTPSRYPAELDQAQLAMTGIGQYEVRVTPLQVAMISAAIANRGDQMSPYLVQTVRTPSLAVVYAAEPGVQAKSISAQTAFSLRQAMIATVENGTGQAARVNGYTVGGKTGTAETGTEAAAHAWFTGFAGKPGETPTVAIAVIVENAADQGVGNTGGTAAAPVARKVFEAVLNR